MLLYPTASSGSSRAAPTATDQSSAPCTSQIANDITQKTPASFEPSIDYVVTKVPRFAFEKFPGSKAELTTMMKSVGEVMAIGRTWQESMQKAMRGLETGLDGWTLPKNYKRLSKEELLFKLRVPNPDRFTYMRQAFEDGLGVNDLYELTKIDKWWLEQMAELHSVGLWLKNKKLADLDKDDFVELKKRGFSDPQIARATGGWRPQGVVCSGPCQHVACPTSSGWWHKKHMAAMFRMARPACVCAAVGGTAGNGVPAVLPIALGQRVWAAAAAG